MSTNTVFGPSDDGAVFLTETLKVNHRYIVPVLGLRQTSSPTLLVRWCYAGGEYFFFGVPKDTADFSTINEVNNYHAMFRIGGNTNQHPVVSTSTVLVVLEDNLMIINSTVDAYYDYAIEWDGTDLHVIACNIGDINTNLASTTVVLSLANVPCRFRQCPRKDQH